MKKIQQRIFSFYVIAFLLLFFLFPLRLSASAQWIEKIMTWTINGEFSKAEDFLQVKIAQTDSALAPCFYLASVLNSEMTHYEDLDQSANFEHLLKYIIRKTDQALNNESYPDSALAKLHFYRGSAYGYLAYFQGQRGQWLPALKNGLRAVKDLKKTVQIDSAFYDAYLGLGTYKYWRSTKLKFALWLPFVPDLREEGIRDIKRALLSHSNSKYMAMHQLIYILTDYGKFDQALYYARKAVKAFPESQFMWWAYAHTYFKAHRYQQALQAYKHLLTLIETAPEKNPSHLLACQVRIAEILRRLGKRKEAHRRAALVLQEKEHFPDTPLNRKRLKKAQEIFAGTM